MANRMDCPCTLWRVFLYMQLSEGQKHYLTNKVKAFSPVLTTLKGCLRIRDNALSMSVLTKMEVRECVCVYACTYARTHGRVCGLQALSLTLVYALHQSTSIIEGMVCDVQGMKLCAFIT